LYFQSIDQLLSKEQNAEVCDARNDAIVVNA